MLKTISAVLCSNKSYVKRLLKEQFVLMIVRRDETIFCVVANGELIQSSILAYRRGTSCIQWLEGFKNLATTTKSIDEYISLTLTEYLKQAKIQGFNVNNIILDSSSHLDKIGKQVKKEVNVVNLKVNKNIIK